MRNRKLSCCGLIHKAVRSKTQGYQTKLVYTTDHTVTHEITTPSHTTPNLDALGHRWDSIHAVCLPQAPRSGHHWWLSTAPAHHSPSHFCTSWELHRGKGSAKSSCKYASPTITQDSLSKEDTALPITCS